MIKNNLKIVMVVGMVFLSLGGFVLIFVISLLIIDFVSISK